MAIPTPEAGLVISYAYLWHREHQAGQEEGRKDRPSVIVLAVERADDATTAVTVLPITHNAPLFLETNRGSDASPSSLRTSRRKPYVVASVVTCWPTSRGATTSATAQISGLVG